MRGRRRSRLPNIGLQLTSLRQRLRLGELSACGLAAACHAEAERMREAGSFGGRVGVGVN
jgi:hypothetical protein